MNKMEIDTRVGRQGDKDVYMDNRNGLFYTIPIMNFREMKRLSNLELNKRRSN